LPIIFALYLSLNMQALWLFAALSITAQEPVACCWLRRRLLATVESKVALVNAASSGNLLPHRPDSCGRSGRRAHHLSSSRLGGKSIRSTGELASGSRATWRQ